MPFNGKLGLFSTIQKSNFKANFYFQVQIIYFDIANPTKAIATLTIFFQRLMT